MVWLVQPRKCKATKRNEMEIGIWTIFEALQQANLFAKCQSQGLQSLKSLESNDEYNSAQKKWNVPFHKKICLWRLVEKLHGQGQVGVVGGKGMKIRDLYD
jgi:predicted Fe-S protein YdhL (DUF1289 family)